MSPNIDDRELVKFRDATGTLSKVAVVVEQDPSNPIPVIQSNGTPFFFSNEEDTVPATNVNLISNLYIGPLERRVISFGVSCHIEGIASLYVDGVFKYSVRTNPSTSNAEFYFTPYLVVTGLIEVDFKARDNSAVTTVSAFIQGTDITI